MKITVLYTRQNSKYNKYLLDTWDSKRNALNWPGGNPIIAHPPCRAWGDLYKMAKPRPGEKQLAIHSIIMARLWGGVVEHPRKSKLWKTMQLPIPGQTDQYGGWTLCINQKDFGHRANKKTFLYIVGCKPKEIPEIELNLNQAQTTIEKMGRAERESTPEKLIEWLIQLTIKINENLNGQRYLTM